MPFPVQARRLFPNCSVEEVPMIAVTGWIRPATLPAAVRRTVDEESPWLSGRDPPKPRPTRT
jgi:hypothetical protein